MRSSVITLCLLATAAMPLQADRPDVELVASSTTAERVSLIWWISRADRAVSFIRGDIESFALDSGGLIEGQCAAIRITEMKGRLIGIDARSQEVDELPLRSTALYNSGPLHEVPEAMRHSSRIGVACAILREPLCSWLLKNPTICRVRAEFWVPVFEITSNGQFVPMEQTMALHADFLRSDDRALISVIVAETKVTLGREKKMEAEAAEPGATDNPDNAQRLREDH